MTLGFTFSALIFDFPSCPASWVFSLWTVLCRLSSIVYRLYSTLVECSLQIRLFMQNEPKFRKSQMNISTILTMNYDKKDTWWSGKTKPIKAN
jgi:hypothetical protein